jgi:small subunit ribosomal protein S11
MGALSRLMESNHRERQARQDRKASLDADNFNPDDYLIDYNREKYEEPYHFHIYATKQNTHITVTRPDRSPIISKSTGDLGFRKASRKTYDAAFQLASYVTGKLQETGKMREITKLEVVLRGFGQGREAVTKALLGSEGRFLRKKIVKVSDATRLKFGGTRGKKPRRLG